MRKTSCCGAILAILLQQSAFAAVNYTKFEGDVYVFAGTDIEYQLGFTCYSPSASCRFLALPRGASIGQSVGVAGSTLKWSIGKRQQGRFASIYQRCRYLGETGCAEWGPQTTILFVVVPYIELAHIEITQGIQDLYNLMPLSPFKHTYVRAYFQVPEDFPKKFVSARLRAFDIEGDFQLTGSPIAPLPSANRGFLLAETNAGEPDNRALWDRTLNFRLLNSWLSGSVKVTIESWDGKPAFDCNPGLNPPRPYPGCSEGALFEEALELHPNGKPALWPEVKIVSFRWLDHQGNFHGQDFGTDLSVATQMSEDLTSKIPVDAVTYAPGVWKPLLRNVPYHSSHSSPSAREVYAFYMRRLLNLLTMAYRDYKANPSGTIPYYYGLLEGPAGQYMEDGKLFEMGGLAAGVPGVVAAGKAWAFPHEMIHLFGYHHAVTDTIVEGERVGVCDSTAPVGADVFPYFYQLPIGKKIKFRPTLGPMEPDQPVFDYFFGLDTAVDDPRAPRVLSPYEHFEIMSYCGHGDDKWTSMPTYWTLVEDIYELEGFAVGNVGQILESRKKIKAWIGAYDMYGTDVIIEQPIALNTSIIPPPLPPGEASMELLDGMGNVIQSISFSPLEPEVDMEEGSSTVGLPEYGLFHVTYEDDPAIQAVRLTRNGIPLTTIAASQNPPTVSVIFPNGGETLPSPQATLSWEGSDPDGDALIYVLQYSPDEGEHWSTIAANLDETEYEIATHLLRESSGGLLRVSASDGYHIASDESDDVFSVANNPPTVHVKAPAPGTSPLYAADQSIYLDAYVYDPDEGPVPEDSIEWSSSVDGVLGFGRTLAVEASSLSEGEHEVIVRATDSGGATAEAATTINVARSFPPVIADLTVQVSGPSAAVPLSIPFISSITVANEGPGTADGILLRIALSDELDFLASSTNQGICQDVEAAIECTLDIIEPEEAITVALDAQGVVEGNGTISASVSSSATDPAEANNQALINVLIDSSAPPAPTADAGGPYAGDEGSAILFEAAGSSSDSVLFHWDFGDGSTGAGSTDTHTYFDDGSYQVTLTVADDESRTDTDTVGVDIANRAPVATAVTAGAGVANEPVVLEASFTDAGVNDAPWAVEWNFGDGTSEVFSTDAQGSVAIDHSYGSSGSYTATVTVTDKDGGSADASIPIDIVTGDADGDGVSDADDQCPGTPTGESVGANGCSASQLDADEDGVSDAADNCPATPAGEAVDANGCSASQLDSDGDGVSDADDQCPATPSGETVDANGCAPSQLDSDNDGVSDADDQCPGTPTGESVGANGCSASQLDADEDGVSDAADNCPATPAGEAVDANGCSASQLDSDGDGVSDADDQCPATPSGETVDANGCAPSQLDSDNDGVSDADDQCPGTPTGESVGANGCSASQLDSDNDGDSVSDDVDSCAETPLGDLVNPDNGCSTVQAFEYVLDEIQTLILDPNTSGKARKELKKAQEKLRKALKDLAKGDVKKALKESSKVVKELLKTTREGTDVGDLIDLLVESARTEAQVAINAAYARGGNQKEIDKALKELDKAQDYADEGKPDKAIDHYAKAREHAGKA